MVTSSDESMETEAIDQHCHTTDTKSDTICHRGRHSLSSQTL